jgi:tRNA pseudouridine13 synthase
VLAGLTLTLPCARSPEPGEPMGESARAVLAGAGLSWRDLRVKKLKDVFLSKGSRDVLFWPGNLRFEALDDALYPRRRAIRLGFELGRGSYATILVKRIAQLVGPEARAGKP